MAISRFFLSLILFSSIHFLMSNACTCREKLSREKKYEVSGWVSHVKILSREEERDEHRVVYHVDHIQIYKPYKLGHNNGKIWENNLTLNCEIHTPNTDGLCGIPTLKVNDHYLLSGDFDSSSNTTLHLHLCRSDHWLVLNDGSGGPVRVTNQAKNETEPLNDDKDLNHLLAQQGALESSKKKELVIVGDKTYEANSTELAKALSDLKTISVEVNDTAIVANATTVH